MPRQERGILGVKKNPKRPMLFLFKVPTGEEWPSDDSEDSDFSPESERKETMNSSEDSDDNSSISTTKPSSHPARSNGKARVTPSKTSARKRSRKEAGSSNARTKRVKRSATPAERKDGSTRQRSSDPGPASGRDPVSHLPPELWLKIFRFYVGMHGPLPFLCRAAKVCRSWSELASHPSLWHKVDLSFGWIKSTDKTLKWLAENRLSQCREISLSGWKNLTNDGFKALCDACGQLEVVNVSHCSKLASVSLAALVSRQPPTLRDLDLSSMSTDAISVQSLKLVVSKLGPTLTSLVLAGNSLVGFNLVLNAIMDSCPNLETLDVSNCRFSAGSLTLNVERFQASCPALRVLRLANSSIHANQVSQAVQARAPGFVKLQQLSCAMPVSDVTCSVSDNLLERLLHKAQQLQLLDLRGCSSFHPDTLLSAPALNVTQLYLAQSSVSRHSHTLRPLLMMWRHSLKVLDLAWTSPNEEHMYAAIKTLTDLPPCPLTSLNLAGTTATLPVVRLALDSLQHLGSLDLTSCRALPRGIKCLHEGHRKLTALRDNLLRMDAQDSGSD